MNFRQIYSIQVMVPPEALAGVKVAVTKAGGAAFEGYSDVFWFVQGTEEFRPLTGAEPAAGKVGELESLPSVQVIFSIPRDDGLLERIVQAVRNAHPWEIPVITVTEARAPLFTPRPENSVKFNT